MGSSFFRRGKAKALEKMFVDAGIDNVLIDTKVVIVVAVKKKEPQGGKNNSNRCSF